MSEPSSPSNYSEEPAQSQTAWQEAQPVAEEPQPVEYQPNFYQPPVAQAEPLPVQPVVRRWSSFWPLMLLAASFLYLLAVQYLDGKKSAAQLVTMQTEAQKPVEESAKVQTTLQNLVTDILELAKTDDKAKAVVDKYQIKQNAPAK